MRKILTVAVCFLISGCAGGPFEWKYGQDKIVPGQFGMTGGDQGSVLTWPSHAVGAIVYPDTKAACIQSAQSAKARSSSGNGGLKVKTPDTSEVSLNLAQAIAEAVTALQDKNDVATFADVSLFQVCTIAANNRLTSEQAMELIKVVMTASVEIAKARPLVPRTVTTIKSPENLVSTATPEKATVVEKVQEIVPKN